LGCTTSDKEDSKVEWGLGLTTPRLLVACKSRLEKLAGEDIAVLVGFFAGPVLVVEEFEYKLAALE
jgi:hypothetical protein